MLATELLAGDIALIRIETPGPVNTLSRPFNERFAEEVDRLANDASVSGIVITSAKSDFAVGGDVKELLAAATPAEVSATVGPLNRALRTLETCGKPVAAALNGTALGGGLEIALAAHRRFAADRPDAVFGLPETSLGLMPGAGGTQRLPRLIGIAAAAEMILGATTLGVADADTAGIIDEVTTPDELIETARTWVAEHPDAAQPWDARGFVAPGFSPNDTAGRAWFGGRWATARAAQGTGNAAANAVLFSIHHGMERRFDAALAVEARSFAELASGSAAKNTIRTGFLGAKAVAKADEATAAELDRIADAVAAARRDEVSALLADGVAAHMIDNVAAIDGFADAVATVFPDGDIPDAADDASRPIGAEEVRNRFWSIQSLAALEAVGDSDIDPTLVDAKVCRSLRFPAHLGGPLGYVDTVGVEAFATTCDGLAAAVGERFAAPTSLGAALVTS